MDTAISADRDPATGYFTVGNDARRAKQRRIAKLVTDLGEEFGGADSLRPGDRAILERAALLLGSVPKSGWDQVRQFNAADRLLNGLRKRLLGRRNRFAALKPRSNGDG